LKRALLVCAVAAGCSPLSSMQTARVLPPGVSRMTFGGGTGYNLAEDQQSVAPVAEVGYRVGVADKIDVGVRVRPVNVLVDTKLQFWDAGRVYASFAPGLSYGGISSPDSGASLSYSELGVHIPIFFGGPIGHGRSEWLLGPKMIGRYATTGIHVVAGSTPGMMALSGEQSRFILLAGGVGGISLGIGRRWNFMLEADVYRDITESTGNAAEIAGGFGCEFGR
jgi:hypothetical protein